MKYITRLILALLALLWVTGVVIAKGFWSTYFALIFAPWGWYLVIEHLLKYNGVL